MTRHVDLFDSTYRNFTDPLLDGIRRETFGQDIGQNSWLTVEEYDPLLAWLEVPRGGKVLEVACGAGGPALYLARTLGCDVTGIDINESGVETASRLAAAAGEGTRVRFVVADATRTLPFADETFDGLVCIDSMNHLPDRSAVLRDWRRVLRPGGRALFTDPVVISGPVTSEELALRSSIGLFVFVPEGLNDKLIAEAGLRLVKQLDVSENAALIARRWHQARAVRRDDLVRLEGEARFEGLQRFFSAVHELTAARRLSRIAYLAERPG